MATTYEPLDVANSFVRQYYQLLASNRDALRHLYSKDSWRTYAAGTVYEMASGVDAIHNQVTSLDYTDVTLNLESPVGAVDAQVSVSGSVLVNVTGLIGFHGEVPSMRFVQSFVLEPLMIQGSAAGTFFVRNDVFRVIGDVSAEASRLPITAETAAQTGPVEASVLPGSAVVEEEQQQPQAVPSTAQVAEAAAEAAAVDAAAAVAEQAAALEEETAALATATEAAVEDKVIEAIEAQAQAQSSDTARPQPNTAQAATSPIAPPQPMPEQAPSAPRSWAGLFGGGGGGSGTVPPAPSARVQPMPETAPPPTRRPRGGKAAHGGGAASASTTTAAINGGPTTASPAAQKTSTTSGGGGRPTGEALKRSVYVKGPSVLPHVSAAEIAAAFGAIGAVQSAAFGNAPRTAAFVTFESAGAASAALERGEIALGGGKVTVLEAVRPTSQSRGGGGGRSSGGGRNRGGQRSRGSGGGGPRGRGRGRQ